MTNLQATSLKTRSLLVYALSSVTMAGAFHTPATHAQTQSQTLPPASLRGYGTLSGTFSPALSNRASVLQINCENPAKAQLVQAKYLSDLGSLPGVRVQADGVRLVRQQGAVAAARVGTQVFVIAAPDAATARALIAQKFKNAAFNAQVPVPMWLDRFDKFNFRHYYRPWEQPVGSDAKYDFVSEFDFAKAQGRAGVVIWNDLLANDSAEGMMNFGWWDWAAQEARKRDLPLGINSSFSDATWLVNRFREQTQFKMPGFVGNFHVLKSPYAGGQGGLSWNATTGEDARLGVMQSSIRRFAAYPNVTTFLEPYGELNHGPQDVFLEYGPVADANYRRYLQEKYRTPANLTAHWKRYVKSWNQVRVSEIASFAGWNENALDLGGTWRIGYEELTAPAPNPYYFDSRSTPASKPAPESWFAPDFDDSSWPRIVAPGNDH